MRPIAHCAVVSGLVLGLAFVTACSSGGGSNGGGLDEQLGSVGLKLQAGPGITINTVSWSIANSDAGFARAGSVNVQSSNTLEFQVGGLPSGSGYDVTLSATTVDGSLSCSGSAPFAVSAGTTTGVAVTLACTPPAPDAGAVAVTGTTAICDTITAVSAAPLETAVNATIALSATASASSPTFAWSATAGTFDDATSATPTFTCPTTPGAVTITVAAGPSDPACGTLDSSSVTVTCDALAPTFTNVYASVIFARCTSCHKPGSSGVTAGMLDLSTSAAAYTNLVGVPAAGTSAGSSSVTCASLAPSLLRVSAGDAASSLLYNKVATKLAGTLADCGSPMPLGSGGPLTQAQIDLIAAWIDAGAPND